MTPENVTALAAAALADDGATELCQLCLGARPRHGDGPQCALCGGSGHVPRRVPESVRRLTEVAVVLVKMLEWHTTTAAAVRDDLRGGYYSGDGRFTEATVHEDAAARIRAALEAL